MRSSRPSSAEGCHRRLGPGLALGLWLAAATAVAQPAAMAECEAAAADATALRQCLDEARAAAGAELAERLAAAVAAAGTYAAIIGDPGAARDLGHAQRAFELYRELDCELGSPTIQADAELHRLACLTDHDRRRAERLATLAPTPPAAAAAIPDALAGTSWRATAIDGLATVDDIESTLSIDATGAISGSTGCNRYFGQATITDAGITLGNLGSTRMACPEPQMDQERRFLEALEQATSWRLEDEQLVLANAEGSARIVFARSSPSATP